VSALGDLAERIDAVVIGASAGGMDALSVVLSALPETLRAPIFVVLHQPRDRPSLLAELFEARCVRPVREPEDKEPIEAGTVYFAPPDYHLLVDDGAQLALSADEPVNYARPSIDVLFESASDAYGSRLLGIVLTGANHDGAAGLSAVDRAGGLAIVQDPKTAQVEVMPAAALAATRGARALPLPEIAEVLRTLGLPGG
jgi:two-component system chemotaxis response regulator CheB